MVTEMHNTAERFYSKAAIQFSEPQGYEEKRILFGHISMGNIEQLNAMSDIYIARLKEMVQDDLYFAKDTVHYLFAQINLVAIQADMSDLQIKGIQEKYYRGLELARTSDEMLALYWQQILETAEAIQEIRRKKQNGPLVQSCCDYIRWNIYGKITAAGVAEAMHFSRSYVSRRFREETGISLNQYIHQEKIAEACRLIDSNVSLAEIGDMLGYTSQSHFTRAFKEIKGITPNQYRKQKNRTAFS